MSELMVLLRKETVKGTQTNIRNETYTNHKSKMEMTNESYEMKRKMRNCRVEVDRENGKCNVLKLQAQYQRKGRNVYEMQSSQTSSTKYTTNGTEMKC